MRSSIPSIFDAETNISTAAVSDLKHTASLERTSGFTDFNLTSTADNLIAPGDTHLDHPPIPTTVPATLNTQQLVGIENAAEKAVIEQSLKLAQGQHHLHNSVYARVEGVSG